MNPIKQILVHLDGSRRSSDWLALARRIGDELGAAVAALYAATPTLVAMPFVPDAGRSRPPETLDEGKAIRIGRHLPALIGTGSYKRKHSPAQICG